MHANVGVMSLALGPCSSTLQLQPQEVHAGHIIMAPPVPLETDIPSQLIGNSTATEAYQLCLLLETLETWPTNTHIQSSVFVDQKMTPKISARLLARMMIEAPVPAGCSKIADDISACKSDDCHWPDGPIDLKTLEQLGRLAVFYRDHFLRLCKSLLLLAPLSSLTTSFPVRKVKGKTPSTSLHTSRPSFDLDADKIGKLLAEAPNSHEALICLVRIQSYE